MPPGYTCDTNVTVTNAGTGPVSTSATMNNTPVVVNWQMSGLATGNSLFWCSGQHLQGTTVTFNGVPMTAIQVQSSVAIVGFAPPGTPGPATVVITNANGCSTSFAYTYL